MPILWAWLSPPLHSSVTPDPPTGCIIGGSGNETTFHSTLESTEATHRHTQRSNASVAEIMAAMNRGSDVFETRFYWPYRSKEEKKLDEEVDLPFPIVKGTEYKLICTFSCK